VKGLLEAHRNTALHPVPVKTVAQQQITALHQLRSRWMGTRTSRINTVRGLLREFDFVLPMGAHRIVPEVMALIEDAEAELPDVLREMFHQVCSRSGSWKHT
jgi:transposase